MIAVVVATVDSDLSYHRDSSHFYDCYSYWKGLVIVSEEFDYDTPSWIGYSIVVEDRVVLE